MLRESFIHVIAHNLEGGRYDQKKKGERQVFHWQPDYSSHIGNDACGIK